AGALAGAALAAASRAPRAVPAPTSPARP
ncbi:MAG: hypothetical protein AVDCRST_MAG13-2657, partial [uncultured Solirubrobacteraceae bacterium]